MIHSTVKPLDVIGLESAIERGEDKIVKAARIVSYMPNQYFLNQLAKGETCQMIRDICKYMKYVETDNWMQLVGVPTVKYGVSAAILKDAYYKKYITQVLSLMKREKFDPSTVGLSEISAGNYYQTTWTLAQMDQEGEVGEPFGTLVYNSYEAISVLVKKERIILSIESDIPLGIIVKKTYTI